MGSAARAPSPQDRRTELSPKEPKPVVAGVRIRQIATYRQGHLERIRTGESVGGELLQCGRRLIHTVLLDV
jgi:hypothetical protein